MGSVAVLTGSSGAPPTPPHAPDLAGSPPKCNTACRIKDAEPAARQARLALCLAVKPVIANVLTMFKVTVPESM